MLKLFRYLCVDIKFYVIGVYVLVSRAFKIDIKEKEMICPPVSPLHILMTHEMTSSVIIFSSTYPRVFAENFDQSRDVFQRMANDEDYYDKDRDTSKFLLAFSQNRFCTSSECLEVCKH